MDMSCRLAGREFLFKSKAGFTVSQTKGRSMDDKPPKVSRHNRWMDSFIRATEKMNPGLSNDATTQLLAKDP